MARCPAHDDRNPSLSIGEGDDGKVLVKCHAGCEQGAVIGALRARGLWNGNASYETVTRTKHPPKPEHDTGADAIRFWNAAVDPRGTIAVEYLKSRKLSLPYELCGDTLRFHPACPWERDTVPCLIAAFRSIADNSVKAIHRIRLDQPERWPKAERKMLGPVGGSAIKLDPAGDHLVIGEGIETCIAARRLGLRPVWALGSSSGIKALAPVAGVSELVILGENDNGTNERAAETCRQNWKGRRMTIIKPRRTAMKDINDVLMRDEDETATGATVERS